MWLSGDEADRPPQPAPDASSPQTIAMATPGTPHRRSPDTTRSIRTLSCRIILLFTLR
jgi:hypothetical protein